MLPTIAATKSDAAKNYTLQHMRLPQPDAVIIDVQSLRREIRKSKMPQALQLEAFSSSGGGRI
jgi:hypothetical protein